MGEWGGATVQGRPEHHVVRDSGTDSTPGPELLTAWTAGYLLGFDRGYEIRGDEVNGAWPPPPVLTFGRWYRQALERERADAEVRRLVAEGGAA